MIRLLPFCALLLALTSIGCTFFGDGVEPATLEPAQISLVTFEQGSAWARAEQATIERFQEKYPQVEIKRQSYNTAPPNYLTNSPPPDVMAESYIYFLQQAIIQGQLADLSDIWTQNKLSEAYPAAFQTATQMNGKHYFIPIGYSWAGIYYNRAVFEQLGLEPPETWTEFILVCDILRDNGIAPLSLSGDEAMMGMLWFAYLNLRLNGPEFHSALMRGEISFTEARVRTVFEAWQHLIDQGYFVEKPEMMTDFDAMTALIRHDDLPGEKAAMVLATSYYTDDLPELFQAELDFFRFPIMDSALPVGEIVEPYGYVVPKDSANLPQTLAFLSYMSSAEAQTSLVQAGGVLGYAPTHLDVDRNILSLEIQQGIDLVETADTFAPNFLLTFPNSMWSEIFNGYERYTKRSGTFDDFMAKLEEGRQESLAEGHFFDDP